MRREPYCTYGERRILQRDNEMRQNKKLPDYGSLVMRTLAKACFMPRFLKLRLLAR
jgi:hypothetical protein